MKRRDFLRSASLAAAAPMMLNGIPLHAMARTPFAALGKMGADSDRVLVLIQLHGGNDGLNTLVPIDQYDRYYNLRPNISLADHGSRGFIPLDGTLGTTEQVGLHPDMIGAKDLYDQGKMAVIQGVGYENINQSHFRSRDIWFMGGDYDETSGSGWMGRYLDHCFPGYPESYPTTEMPDPLAIELGNDISLAFHRDEGIPAGISIVDPDNFFDLVTGVGGEPPIDIADSHYGKELLWIIGIEKQSNKYAARLKEVYDAGHNSSVDYPERYPFQSPGNSSKNGLSGQLKLISRLLQGGSKTKIFLARMGGFDTHASQVEAGEPSMGGHAALLGNMTAAIKAFQDDLKLLGLEDRVLTATFSEFGRRASSNGSYGTDHGTSAPMLLFGKHLNGGIYGTNPDISPSGLVRGDNLDLQHDYREVFTTVLQDWLGADGPATAAAGFQDYEDKKITNLFADPLGVDDFQDQRWKLHHCFPNPVTDVTTFSFRLNRPTDVYLNLYDIQGNLVKSLITERKGAGEHVLAADLRNLAAGAYVYRIKAGPLYESKKLIKIK